MVRIRKRSYRHIDVGSEELLMLVVADANEGLSEEDILFITDKPYERFFGDEIARYHNEKCIARYLVRAEDDTLLEVYVRITRRLPRAVIRILGPQISRRKAVARVDNRYVKRGYDRGCHKWTTEVVFDALTHAHTKAQGVLRSLQHIFMQIMINDIITGDPGY